MRWAMASSFGTLKSRPGRGGKRRLYLCFGRYGKVYGLHGDPFPSEDAARMVLASIRSLVAANVPKAQAVERFLPTANPRHRFKPHLDGWLAMLQADHAAGDLSPGYLREVVRWLGDGEHAHIAAFWGKQSVYSVDYPKLVAWKRWLEGRGLSAKTIHNVMAAFHAALEHLRTTKMLGELPPFPWPRLPEYTPTILSRSASDRVLAAIPEDRRGIYLVLTRLGARPSETMRLTIRDYTPPDGDEPGWLVFRKTKNDRVKRLPTPVEVDAWLATWAGLDKRIAEAPLFLLPYAGRGKRPKRWSATALRREWHAACAAAGVPHTKLYEGTKHTGATDLLARVGDERVVQAVLGHIDPRSTRRYAQLRPMAVVEAIRGGDGTNLRIR
jgi:integrase